MSEHQIINPILSYRGKIYFQGYLLNRLIESGFQCKAIYDDEYTNQTESPDIIRVSFYSKLQYFQVFKIEFQAQKTSPTIITSTALNNLNKLPLNLQDTLQDLILSEMRTETYLRLEELPETVTNVDEAITELLDFYWRNKEFSKAQLILHTNQES